MDFKQITVELSTGKSVVIKGNELSNVIKKKLNKEMQKFIQPKRFITEPGSFPMEDSDV